MVRSDQGGQYSSSDWRSFLKANNLVASMSRRGNCHNNAVAESFLQLLKREGIKRKISTTPFGRPKYRQRNVIKRTFGWLKAHLYVVRGGQADPRPFLCFPCQGCFFLKNIANQLFTK
ncbi:transposase InsO family protein [Pseudomonas sp. GGS8]|nr:transposase InsO family protein [Pseudomonas sp. GGS8]